MLEIRVEIGEGGLGPAQRQNVLAHAQERERAARGAVEPAQQILPARFRRPVQGHRRGRARIGLIGRDGGIDACLVGAEIDGEAAQEALAFLAWRSRITDEQFPPPAPRWTLRPGWRATPRRAPAGPLPCGLRRAARSSAPARDH